MVSFRDSMYTGVTGVRSILRNGCGVAPELFLDPLRAIGCFAQACAIETRIPKIKSSVGLFAQKMLRAFTVGLGKCAGAKISGAN